MRITYDTNQKNIILDFTNRFKYKSNELYSAFSKLRSIQKQSGGIVCSNRSHRRGIIKCTRVDLKSELIL